MSPGFNSLISAVLSTFKVVLAITFTCSSALNIPLASSVSVVIFTTLCTIPLVEAFTIVLK